MMEEAKRSFDGVAIATRDEPRVIFVMSTNYAGSTVLGLVAGSHSEGAFLGEPFGIVRKKPDGSYRNHRFCSVCDDEEGSKCPVWNQALIEDVRRNPDDVYDLTLARLSSQRAPRFLVDASKDMKWMEEARARRLRLTPSIVHITKSVESYAASVLLRQRGKWYKYFELVGQQWAHSNRDIRNYAVRHSLPYLHVRYEDFALDFDRVLAALGVFAGFEPQREQREFWAHEHHYVKGNPGTASHFKAERAEKETGINREIYKKNHRTIFLDEKWKTLISPAQINRLYALPDVRRESLTLGYAHPLRRTGTPLIMRGYGRLLSSGFKLRHKLSM